jgi:hypothetical protein
MGGKNPQKSCVTAGLSDNFGQKEIKGGDFGTIFPYSVIIDD